MAIQKMCYPAIEERRADLGVPKQKMAKYLDISASALDNKLAGRSEFQFSEIKKLSEWWGTPIEAFTIGAFPADEKSASAQGTGRDD